MAGRIAEGELSIDGVKVFYRRTEGEGTPVVYCHGNPTHGEEWMPFMARSSAPGVAIDMPGWGRSDRPDPRTFDYSMDGLSAFLERCLDELGIGRRKLLVHDWGALTLIGAQRRPQLVEKLVVADAVPLLPGYRWHWIAQLWRRRPLGEFLNATTAKPSFELLMRQARGDRGPMPREFIEMVWEHWDKGTKDATLALYRHADPKRLAAAGKDLDRLTCPTLVLWADRDLYLPVKFGEAYAAVLPDAKLEVLKGRGHWPWVEDPGLIDRILRFLA